LSFEAVVASGVPWAAFVTRSSDELVTRASFGLKRQAAIPSSALSESAFSFNDDRAIAVELRPDHLFIIPETPSLSASTVKELRRIASRSSVSALAKDRHSVEPFSSVEKLLEYGSRRKFPFASLFSLDASAIVARTTALCPHSVAASVDDELYAYLATAIGSTARAYSLRRGVCLCAFYCHAYGDAELMATQISRSLNRLLSLSDDNGFVVGPCASFKLSDDEAAAAIGSFIDGLK